MSCRQRAGWGSGSVRDDGVVDDGEARVLLKEVGALGAEQLAAQLVGLLLHDAREGHLQAARQVEVQLAQDDAGGTALARLRVGADMMAS